MSFLKSLFGGSESKGTTSSAAGYSTLPSNLRAGFDQLGQGVAQYTNPNDPANIARFTPMGETADETAAYGAMRRGFTPTSQSLNTDLSMLMNPYNDYVIGGVNNQANSDFSILKQNMDQAGQFGSNRQMLGANDIELQRQNQIGGMLQGQYNQALGQVFNNLVPQRQQDAMNLMGVGDRQRALDMQTKQAPINALQAGTSMIAPFTSNTSNGYNATNNYGEGIISGLSKGASAIGTMMAACDIRLKENIVLVGKENGHNIYEFNYIGKPERWQGVMAQEVLETNPEAVITTNDGYYAVDYGKLGIEFRRIV